MRVMSIGTVMVDVLAVGLPGIAEPGTVVYTPYEIETRIGGHPIDVAIDLVLLGADPAEVGLVAALGEGPYGRIVQAAVDEYGFVACLQSVHEVDTGKNVVLQVGDEDRRFHIDPGANWRLHPDHVARALTEWAPELVTLRPGYTGIDLDLQPVLDALGEATVLLDVMQPHPSRPPGYLDAAVRRADIVHCNRIEATVTTGAATVEGAVGRFLAAGVKLVLLTSGGDGATAYTPGHRITQRGFSVEVVDPTGCGDAFCAGVALDLVEHGGRIEDLGPDRIARMLLGAQAVGASAATAVGCVEGVSAALVDEILAEQGDALLGNTRIETHTLTERSQA